MTPAALSDRAPLAGGRRTGLVARLAGLGERGGQKGARLPAHIRRIAANRAASTVWWWSTEPASPLAATVSAANVHISQLLAAALEAIVPVRGKRGRPRQRPGKLHADNRACSQCYS